MDELKYVRVGFDRFRAELLVEACIAAGLEVKLLAADDSGFTVDQPHRLLVRSNEFEKVLAIIQQ